MSGLDAGLEKILVEAQREQEKENFLKAIELYIQAFKICDHEIKKDIVINIGNCNYMDRNYLGAIKTYLSSIKLGHNKKEINEMILELFYEEEKGREVYENNVKLLLEYKFIYNKHFLPFEQISDKIIYMDDYNVVVYSIVRDEIYIVANEQKINENDTIGKVIFIASNFNLRYLTKAEIKTMNKTNLLSQKEAFYLYYNYFQSFSTLLTYEDIYDLLISERVVFLIGKDDIKNFFGNTKSCIPTYTQATPDINTMFRNILTERERSRQYAVLSIKKYYIENKDKIVENIKTGKFKILFLTSRYTTALQYHSYNCYNACIKLGYNAGIYIEDSDIHNNNDLVNVIDKFKPEIIFCIDWFRFMLLPFVDEVVFVSWIQDYTPQILSKDTPPKIKERDFILNHCITDSKILNLGYPKERLIDAPVGVNQKIYKKYELTKEEYAKYSCDIVMVCHSSYSRGEFEEFKKSFNVSGSIYFEAFDKSLNDIYETYIQLFKNGNFNITQEKNTEVFINTFYKNNLKVEVDFAKNLYIDFMVKVLHPLYREVLVTWLIDAGYTNIKLWGYGWLKNEKFEAFAMGPAKNGEELSKIYNASKITIGNNLAGTGTARVFEAIMSGCFYLSNVVDGEDIVRLDKILINNDEFICFNSKNDLINKIDYYLNNPEERERIIIKGQKKILEKQTFEALMKNMVNNIKQNL